MNQFLMELQPVLPDEKDDFDQMRKRLIDHRQLIVFQPAIIPDLQPMAHFEQTGILQEAESDGKNLIWLVSTGEKHSFGCRSFETLISDFYINDELPDLTLPDSIQQLELEEMLLLRSELLPDYYELPLAGKVNVAYVSLLLSEERRIHVFVCVGRSDQVWNVWTIQSHCGMDWLVESHKGMEGHFRSTVLYQKLMEFDQKDLLPPFYYEGKYALYHMSDVFLCFNEDMAKGEVFRLYLCSWGRENPDALAYAETVLKQKKMAEQDLKENRARFEALKKDITSSPPLEAMRGLYASLQEQIRKDGGPSDFQRIEDMPFYKTYNNAKTERLWNRAEYFSVVSALFLWEKTEAARAEAYADMDSIVQYHISRYEKYLAYPRAYVFLGADRELRYFAEAVYDDVKIFSAMQAFAEYIGSHRLNLLEEQLLRIAYDRKDNTYAEWLIENQFRGEMQPAFFYIICNNDEEKADAIIKRLRPRCIAWIMIDYYSDKYDRFGKQHSLKYRSRSDEIDPISHIFSLIDKSTADQVKNYLKRKTEVRIIYDDLMQTYFP